MSDPTKELIDNYYFVLDGHEPREVHSIEEWATNFDLENRQVNLTDLGNDVYVSTVFLGMNYRLYGEGKPLLFETMVFGGPNDKYQERCSTWPEAVAQHKRVVDMVQK